MQIRALLVAIAVVTIFPLTSYAGTVDPAQAIAQKFSEAADQPPAPPPPPRRKYDPPGASYEADMLQQARAEEHERQQEDARESLAKPAVLPRPVVAQPMLAQPALAQPVVAPAIAIPEVPAPPITAAAVPLPVQATAPSPPTPQATQLAALPVKPVAEPSTVRPDIPQPDTTSATVLLVLDPDNVGLGFKPDPIICIDDRCWISNGLDQPAHTMARNEAVALQGTDGVTQDSCGGKSGCVYRGVTIDPSSRIDVINVGEGGGASAGNYTVTADQSCRKQGETLACDNGLATRNFHIWVVPEATANAVGVSSLENAVAEGLPEFDISSSNDK